MDIKDIARNIRDLSPQEKIYDYKDMPEIIRNVRPTVLVQGVFDILHLGHIQYIQRAARFGIVIAGLENDEAVRTNKGPERPINSLQERMLAVAAFQEVGLVFGFTDIPLYSDPNSFNMYVERYRTLNPLHIAVPEDDPNFDQKRWQAIEAEVAIARIPGHYPNSTTQMLGRVGYQG
jgi:cytidyltransferase-like protein